MNFRSFALMGLFGASMVVAQAQVDFSNPCVVLQDGNITGVAWNLDGGQLISARYRSGVGYWNFRCGLSLYDHGLLNWAVDQINTGGKSGLSNTYAMYGIQKAMRLANNGTYGIEINAVPTGLTLTLPACDSSSKAQDGATLEFRAETKSPKSTALPLIYFQAPKRQKLWNASAFRLQIAGMATDNVSRVVVTSIQVVTDPTVTAVPARMMITVPTDSAQPFMDWLKKNEGGAETFIDSTLSYLDDDGQTIMTVSCPITPIAVDVSNPLLPSTSPDNAVTIICKFPDTKTPIIKGNAL